MQITKSERIIPCDIDDTLVLTSGNAPIGALTVDIYDAVTEKFIKMAVHESMVRLLKEESHRGAYILVWSRGGYEWAANVIRALHLEEYVDQVMSKPITYFDDKNVAEWMKDRVYLEPGTNYKGDK